MATVESILGKYEEKISGLGFQIRAFLLKELKGITEYADGPANIIGYGYGPGYYGYRGGAGAVKNGGAV